MMSFSTFVYLALGASVLSYVTIPILLLLVYVLYRRQKVLVNKLRHSIAAQTTLNRILIKLVEYQGLEVIQGPTVDIKKTKEE
jgi:hypothetical protein